MVEIHTVRALSDNYCYVISSASSREAIVIDPSEAQPICEALDARGLTLIAIFNTHHHFDHVGGNTELTAKYLCPVYCSIQDQKRIPGASNTLQDGDTVELIGEQFDVLSIPGHTRGQVAFYLRSNKSCFVGDTVFAMGCGRLLEGTAEQMFASLNKLTRLPPETRLYFGHEYTSKNAAFARAVEPSNTAILRRLEHCTIELSKKGYASPPSIAEERRVNPFLRTDSKEIRDVLSLDAASDLEVFTKLREMRNSW